MIFTASTPMSTTNSIGLGQYARYIPVAVTSVASFFGFFIAAQGVRGMLTPADYVPDFGLPDKQASNTAVTRNDWRSNPWIFLTGARNLSFGLGLLAFRVQNDVRAMGTLLLSGLIVSAADAYVTWNVGLREKGWSHIYGSCVCGAMGAYLLSLSMRPLALY